ncbi:hypothetical protein HHI36_019175 [Cryptolaemus montrouzieri]
MFNTRSEVDKHVEKCLRKITNEKERNSRSYNFAKLYYNIGDYEQTRRYITAYLSVKPKSSEGHYLLGLVLEKLSKKEAALEAYKTSLQLNPKQNNLVLKVCELLAKDDVNIDLSEAKHLCELAENMEPGNPSVYNLKEKLIISEQKNPEDVIKVLLKELENRPADINLRIRLLRNLVQNNQINEAYKHITQVEEQNLSLFSNNSMWYEIVVDVLIRYKRQSPCENFTSSFWFLFISALDKMLGFKLDERNDNVTESSEYINQLFTFDQSLYEASKHINECPDKQFVNEFLNHYRGQLYLHFTTTIFKQAKKDLMEFKEAAAITLPLLFAAYHSKPIDLQASWFNYLQESQKKYVKRWYREGAFRCSQSGHTLLAAAKDRKATVIAKATQHSSGMWQEQLFKKVFVVRDQQLKMTSSSFVTDQIEVNLKLPDKQELLTFDEESLYMFPDLLHHYIWVSLNNDLAELKYLPFQGLQYSVKNLSNCGAETLNLLDVQAFIFCASLCAKANVKNLKRMLYYNTDRPNVLPEIITAQLGSIEQSKFLLAAYKMYKNEPGFDSGEMRLTLIRGIETVRCIGRHGLDLRVLVKLADIFADKAKKLSKKSEIEFCDARAEIYWNAALPLLEKMANNQAVTYSSNRIFECKTKDIPLSEVFNLIAKAKLFLGLLAMKRDELEKALNKFEELKDPFASFYQAQIYKQLADHKMSQNKESVTSEMRSQNIILLSKARDCFYLTLDRLREPSVDKNHPLNAQLGTEIEKIERLLSRIDPDCTNNRNECDGMSDENESLADSTEHYTTANLTNLYSSAYIMRNDTRNNHSTPLRLNLSRKEARPSPERLDAQFRQLNLTVDSKINQVLEQTKFMIESQRNLVEELRSFKEAEYNLAGQVDSIKMMKSNLEELKSLSKRVDELKISVEELQNFRTVTDLVYELKREIVDMKKDNAKHHQQTNDDLYVLDDEYPDYNISGNVNFNSNLYPNYSGRFPQTVPPPAALYPHGLYPALYGSIPPYGYPNLGLSQPPISYGAEQQLPPDLRGLPNPLAQTNPLYSAQFLGQPPTVPPPVNPTPSNANTSLLAGQGLSQIGTQPNVFKDPKISQSVLPTSTISISSLTSTKSAPVNVVITSSDPLPALQSSVSQPVLSVTIPPQHLKGGLQKSHPHNYQIALPATSVNSTPSVLSKPAPAISTEGMLSNIAPPVYSAVSDKKTSKNLGLQIEKSLEETFASAPPPIVDLTKLQIPSFESQNEVTLFECPAKLYSFVDSSKEFEERGNGLFKLLENKEENTVRILMRIQDLGKVIANHYITKDMKIASTKDNAYYWSAVDYSKGNQTIEKFCLKFKNSDDAGKFYDTFEKCKQKLGNANAEAQITTGNEENKKTVSESKNVLGGFLFKTNPIFKPTEIESTPTLGTSSVKSSEAVENKTQSPFANFSFGVLNKSGNKSTPTLLSNLSSSVIEAEETKTPDQSKLGDNSLTDDFIPTAEFQPVIPLPDMVEVKTGEENAEVLFNCRAKLLRFDSEKKEWKERGLGNMKILKEKTLIRLLMRREQIHKVCCNHQLLKNINFQYMPNNFKAITWCAQDYADEVLKAETFAIRFKTEEQANDFLKCVLNCQSSLSEDSSLETKEPPKKEDTTSSQGFGGKFKPAKGNWECKVCYISNEGKANKCIACESPKPSPKKLEQAISTKQEEANLSKSESISKSTSTWGDAFKPKAGTWECQSCLIRNESNVLYCISCESPKDDTVPKKESSSTLKGINLETPYKFNFGISSPAVATPNESSKNASPAAFKFGTPVSNTSSGFSFGSAAFTFQSSPIIKTQTPSTPKEESSTSFVFGSPVAHEFEFKPRSPRKSSGQGEEESDCSFVEEEADNIYFKPVIPLPNKVEVKTGEEDEEVLYCHRAKLFRFVGGEWKERGIGDLKILKNKSSNKMRVLMRREQVLKICLNHALTSNVEYLPKDDKTWLFSAADFSEGEVSHDQFCIRFKNAEIAHEFKEAVTKALDETNQSGDPELSRSDDSSDVEFISETTVIAEDVKEAQRLGLPPKFFAYRQLPPCTCDQCVKDDEYFEGTVLAEKSLMKDFKNNTTADKSSVCESSVYQTPSPTSSNVSAKQETLRDILSKPSTFALNTSNKEDVFFSPTIVSPNVSSSTTIAGNLFGSKFGASTNLFSDKTKVGDNSTLKSFSFTAKAAEGNSTLSDSPNIFTSSSATENKPSLFSGSSSNPSNLFGGTSKLPTNLFGSTTAIPSTNIFGTGSTKATTNIFCSPSTTTNLFGNKTSITTTASNIFGSITSTTSSVNENKSSNLFGNPKVESSANPFGFMNTGSLFGSNSTSLFGSGAKFEFGKQENIFGNPTTGAVITKPIAEPTSETAHLKTSDLKENDEIVLKCSSEISFSSLAQQNQNVAPAFEKSESGGDMQQPFSFLGAGAPVFGSKKKQDADSTLNDSQKREEGDEGNDESGADEEYDPHYEPIIPMPEAVVVTTGEEDESALFNERAKLFRYDADLKEWKERGVGQMKILFHPQNGTYRFLLRREQVHKVVLNQLITPSLELQPMTTSDKAWIWAGYNYVEEETNLEKLAIKFKYTETAQKFFDSVQACLAAIKEVQNQTKDLPATIENYGLENVSSDSDPQDENYPHQYDDNDYDEEDDPYDDDYDEKR